MGDPRLDRIRQLAESPGVSPELREKALARLSAVAPAAAPVAAPGPPTDPYDALRPKMPTPAPSGPAYQPSMVERASNFLERNADTIQDTGVGALRGLDKSLTFGALGKVADMIEPGSIEAMDAAAARHPIANVGASVVGALTPWGGANRLGQAMNSVAGVGKAGGFWSSVGRGAAGGALGAGGQAAAEGVVEGKRPDAIVEQSRDALAAGGVVGGAFGGLGHLAKKGYEAIRDPATQLGRDIASATSDMMGGATSLFRGFKPGKAYDEVDAIARKTGTISPAGVAEQQAVPEMGGAIQRDMDRRLGPITAENAEFYGKNPERNVSLQPVVNKIVQRLHQASSDRKMLPGQNPSALVRALKESATVRTVPRTDPIIDTIEPDNMLDAGFARHLGLISGRGDEAEMVVILQPRKVTASELEVMRKGFDKRGNVQANTVGQASAPEDYKALAGSAREAREQLGPERVAQMRGQEKSLQEMHNTQRAAGLPEDVQRVNTDDLQTQEGIAAAIRRYRTRGNEAADRTLDELAKKDNGLRLALEKSAGVSATQRLRRDAAVPMTPSGVGAYGLKDAAKLRSDPVLRYLSGELGNAAAGVGAASTRNYQ